MAKFRTRWLVRDRKRFITKLAQTGDPAAAALEIGRTVDSAYRLREAHPGFAAEWRHAVEVAWEQIETKVLVGLLAACENDPNGKLIDSRLAVAVLQRREQSVSRKPAPAVDIGRVSGLRAEIERLAALR